MNRERVRRGVGAKAGERIRGPSSKDATRGAMHGNIINGVKAKREEGAKLGLGDIG
jgi:hypothetical protein